MRVALLRVGIDSGSGGCQGPLLKDGSFEFVPIPQGYGAEQRTYANTLGRHGRYLADFLPATLRMRLQHTSMHVDPEFETFTYGDPTPPKAGLRRLETGDLLVFYAGLEGWGFSSPPALYIVGYFEVLAAGRATDFATNDIDSLFQENMHVRHNDIYEEQKPHLILVKGASTSRLLKKAVCISQMATDRSGKPLKVLSDEMRDVFGGFGGHVSIQRSPTRWVADAFVERAAAFVRSLE